MKKSLWVVLLIFILHPAGALITDVLQSFERNHFTSLRPVSYLLTTVFAATIPISFLLWERFGPQFLREVFAVRLFLIFLMIALSLFAQVTAFWYLHLDALNSLAFAMGPLALTAVYCGIVGLLSLVVFAYRAYEKRRAVS